MTAKELIRLLKKDGWEHVGSKGSHYKFRKGNRTEIVPFHGGDVSIGVANSILKRLGLK